MGEPTRRADGAGSDAGTGAGRNSRYPAPFAVGFAAAVGVGIAYLIFRSVVNAHDILILVGVALFFATGLDPVVRLIQRSGLSRGLSVATVFLALIGLAIGFGFVVVPPLADQTTAFVHNVPSFLNDLEHNRQVARLDNRFHVIRQLQQRFSAGTVVSSLAGNVLSAGTVVVTSLFELFSVLILTLYFMAYLDDILDFAYRMVPRSRRERAELIGDEITAQVGAYVAGNIGLAVVAGVAALVWLELVHAPYPFALAFAVAILDVLPLIGATVAALIASTVMLLQSVPLGIATIVFFVVYQQLENHLLMPRLMPPAVHVNPAAVIIGALAGAALLGVIGFLLAIPLVAVANLVVREVLVPRQAAR